MSTNPNNAIGTNGAYGGRTSVEALNDILNVFTGGGIVRGWECSPSSGMTVSLGGVSGYRDVAIAVSPTGTRTTVNNRTTSPVDVTLSTAPASNSRIDVIVAYVQNPPQGSTTVVDNAAACGIIPVSGTVSSSPTAPSDSDIRSAITADGGTGSTAYYVILATITVLKGVTTITSNYITQGAKVTVGTNNIASSAVTAAKIASSAVTATKIASSAVTAAKIASSAVTADKIAWTTFIKTGTATVAYQGDNSAGGFVEIKFDKAFTNKPVVFAQDILGNGRVSSLSASNVSTTGFRLLARNAGSSSAGSQTVNWLAISMKG